MNKKQLAIAKKLKQDFERAGQMGLSGGIFNGSLCLWPVDNPPTPGSEFFEEIEENGGVILFPDGIWLDGGAGT